MAVESKPPSRESGLWLPVTGVRERLGETRDRFVVGTKEWLTWNILHNTVKLNRSNEVGNRITEELARGNMPCGISSHEGHGDGMAFALAAEDIMFLWSQIGINNYPQRFPLRGAIAPMARSWKTGHQGAHLKNSYEFLKPAAERMGLFTMPHTRPKDIRKYKLSRELIMQEKDEFEARINEGFMPLLLPAASVIAGRHPEGASMEDINGMPLIRNNVIRDSLETTNNAAKNLTGGESFFVLLALHGSFRYVRAEGDNEPKLTRRGLASLALGAVKLPLVLPKIQATMLMPVTRKEIIADLGSGGLRDSMVLNDYIMRKIAADLPLHARGAYK